MNDFNGFTGIKPVELTDNPFKMIGDDWMLITAGGIESHKTFNTMTASWGGLGILWHKPVSYIFVRPNRYTYEFTEKHALYTLSVFDEKFKKALTLCGSVSGRDRDKVTEAGLTPVELENGAIGFREARLILACKKLYYQDLTPDHFIDPTLDKNYPNKDYHRMYVGEVIGVYTK